MWGGGGLRCLRLCEFFQAICPCDYLWNWPLSGAFVFLKHILFLLIYMNFQSKFISNSYVK